MCMWCMLGNVWLSSLRSKFQAAYGASETSVSLTINGVSYIIDFVAKNQVSHSVQNDPRCNSEFCHNMIAS